MSNKNLLSDIGKTPRQLADERERNRVVAGNYEDVLSHLPQAGAQVTAPMQGHAPHYSLGVAIQHEEALAGTSPKNIGGYQDGVPMKQASGARYPDREARATYATALEQRQAAELAERVKAANNASN